MNWPFHREERALGGTRYDATGDILSWVQRTFGEADRGMTPVFGLTDSPAGVGEAGINAPDWLPNLQDVAPHVEDRLTEVTEEAAGDGSGLELDTIFVVITTQRPEATEGEAHIFANADEAKRFVERLIDGGFDQGCIRTVRGGAAPFSLSFRAVVDFG